MAKYRKLPVVIEAQEFKGSSTHIRAIDNWMDNGIYSEPSIVTCDLTVMTIITLEGVMTANPGDFIIKGVNGEFYPCKPDIFNKTYELVKD